ncbi:heterokaryon incompatibility protein (HET) domain-containing protein [Sarocladium implicatum]|nr:heterokaryon incompatibility protein (HET) domain-containing protein [Sarocladium implicatum]
MEYLKDLCDFCQRFWKGDIYLWEMPVNGFERDLTEMNKSAANGCHCCAIFSAQSQLIFPYQKKLGLGSDTRICILMDEKMQIFLGMLGGPYTRTPLRFVLRTREVMKPKLSSVIHESSTGSASSFIQARQWLQNCRESHPDCRKPVPEYAPSRLLHIDPDTQTVQLQHKVSLPNNLQYATLSHCWGQAVLQCLKQDSISIFEKGIPFSELAQTFQDAVRACQEFELSYIWIDCFCIIQDSPQDWIVESLQMRQVYSNASLNIAATDSRDSHGGLFRERNVLALRPFEFDLDKVLQLSQKPAEKTDVSESKEEETPIDESDKSNKPDETTEELETVYYLTDIDLCWDTFEQSPLNLRSWVLQERLLSPRVLHYDKDQLVWECDSLTACERFPGPDGISGLIPNNKRIRASIDKLQGMQKSERVLGQELHDIWRPIVKSYTACGLTKHTDRLIALNGIAQRLSQMFDSDYVAGFFTHHMESQLAWRLGGQRYNLDSRVPDVRVAPSWSWASFLGEIDMLPQWDAVDSVEVMRRLGDEELQEMVLCKVTNKEQILKDWSPSATFKSLPLEVTCFMAQVRLIDFSEAKAWPKTEAKMRVWRPEDSGPTYGRDTMPFQEDRPLDDLWPLRYAGGGGGGIDFDLYEGVPGQELMVHSRTDAEKDSFKVKIDLDIWTGYRQRRTLYLMPTYEVTRYEPQDLFEKYNIRVIHGLILERLGDEGNRFCRIGMFSVDGYERTRFWQAAVCTDVPGLSKHEVKVPNWPDVEHELKSSGDPFNYNERDDAPQYQTQQQTLY